MITLEVLKTVDYNLSVEVVSSTIAPKELFLFKKDLNANDIYVSVCNLRDLLTYQIFPQEGIPFFRKSNISVQKATPEEVENYLVEVTNLIKQLEVDYKKYLDDGKYGTPYTIVINEDL